MKTNANDINTEYLKYSDFKENSVIMIDFENHTKELFFIAQVKLGLFTKPSRIKLYGRKLNNIVEDPLIFDCSPNKIDEQKQTALDLFLSGNIENPFATPEGVRGYRNLTLKEKEEWLKKISHISHLAEITNILRRQ